MASWRDRILFEAGVAAGRRQMRWRAASVLVALFLGSGGWIIHERVERGRLEMALAERPVFAGQVIADHHQTRQPTLEPMTLAPLSYLAWSHHFEVDGTDLVEPVEPAPSRASTPTRTDQVLTPLSSRRGAEMLNL